MFFRFSIFIRFCNYLSLFLLFSFSNAYSSDVIKVCFSTLPPWKMVNGNNFEGPGAEIVLAIAEKLNKKVEFAEMPFKRGLYYMEHGEFDIMTGLLRNKKREEYILYIDPPYKKRSNKVFYILKDGQVKIEKYEDLYPLNIGTQRAVSYFEKFDRDEQLKKHSVKRIRQSALMLLNGRIETFIATDSSADYILKKMGFRDRIVKSSYGFYDENPVYIGISRKSRLNKPETVRLINDMIINGEIDSIIVSFFKKRGLPVPDYK